MYHHQGKNDLFSSRITFLPDWHLFLQGGNVQSDSGLVLSTDAKPRLKWTPELNERFIEAVNQLGGADKATPKTVMSLMSIPGLTLYHLKSHLQKYRHTKNLQAQSSTGTIKNVLGCTLAADRTSETDGSLTGNADIVSETNKTMQISEALLMQIEVQRQLDEQLEVQRHLQLRIEAQGKYLQSVLEKAQETLGKQNLGSTGLEAAKAQLSEIVTEVSNECQTNSFPDSKETHSSHTLHARTAKLADCLMDSCLSSCEESRKDQDIHNASMRLTTYHGNSPLCAEQTGEDMKLEQTQLAGNERKILHSSILKELEMTIFPVEKDPNVLSVNVKNQRLREDNSIFIEGKRKVRDTEYPIIEQPNTKKPAAQQENGKQSNGTGQPCLTAQLDLNTSYYNDAAQGCKQFDLNGFSWS